MSRLEDFVADVAKSGLLSRSELEAAAARIPPGPEAEAHNRLARILVGEGKLTAYQANKLLSGATRGFFLDGYRILRRIGQGGTGKVYLAVQDSTGDRVALKVLPPRKALEEEQALVRFRRETDLSRRVTHPNLARTIDFGESEGVHYMVMEYVPGDSLYNIVRSPQGGPLSVPDAARFFLQVLDALHAAHEAGLVHRDIKPSNLMLTPDGQAKILDLGLAKALGEESPLARPNLVLGTLDYASPEQLSDAAQADRRSDLYSVGCSIYFALAGQPPFPGGDLINKIYKQRMEEPQPLEKVAPGVPNAFATIVRKLMAKDPAARYQDAKQVQTDLHRWTNPELVATILGDEAAQTRDLQSLSSLLDEDELRIFDESSPDDPEAWSSPSLSQPAHFLHDDLFDDESAAPPPPMIRVAPTDDRWLIRFIAVVCFLGALAIILIALFGRG